MNKDSYLCKYVFFLADIDDMNICYILRDRANATNDIFSFSIEDSGKWTHLNMSSLNWARWHTFMAEMNLLRAWNMELTHVEFLNL